MSNILSVFNPPPSRPLSNEEVESSCIPCTIIQSILCVGGGAYFSSGFPLKDSKTGKIDLKKNPIWWQKSVRITGVLLIGLGAYRFGEAFQMLYRKRFG